MGMNPNVDSLIAKAEQMEKSGDRQGAVLLTNDLVTRYPNEIKVWSLRGYLHRRSRNYAEAIADLTRAIDINATELSKLSSGKAVFTAVDLFFNRGTDRFSLGDNQSAIDDFTKGLDLCDRHRSDDYRETLLFWRAEALLRLGKKHEAWLDLARVRDDFSFWTYKLRTKADLLNDCGRLPG